jgi:hypothetical protein
VRRALLAAAGLLLAGCAVTPLSNRIQAGQDAFVIGVGEGADAQTDLFAAPAAAGAFYRLTFTRAVERLPRLSPSGTAVAFVRSDPRDTTRWSLVALDLRTTGERTVPLPPGAAGPLRLGWHPDGRVVVRTSTGYLMLPPGGDRLLPVPPDGVPGADSLTRELLGEPPAAMVVDCPEGGLCIEAANGETGSLGAGVRDAIRWGADSIGYFSARGFEVRPLAGGPPRQPAWSRPPGRLRSLTHHGGTP